MFVSADRLPGLAWRAFVDAVTPCLCLACMAPVTAPASLCPACWARLQHIDDPVCDMLGTPFAYDQGRGMLSAAALADPAPWEKARAAVVFDETSRRLVHALKYQDRQEAGLLMARMMARAGRELLADADLLLPVPLHRWRLWRRRFNQAAVLAGALSRASGRPWRGDLLVRRRRTASQVGLDPDQRRKNVRGAFAVAAGQDHALAGKSVLLVDDVRTTGATATACVQALRASGARTVTLLTFALVPASARLHI